MYDTRDDSYPIHSGSRWEPMPLRPAATTEPTTPGAAPVESARATPRPARRQRWLVIAFLTMILTAGAATAGVTLAGAQDDAGSYQTTRVTRAAHPDGGSAHRRADDNGGLR